MTRGARFTNIDSALGGRANPSPLSCSAGQCRVFGHNPGTGAPASCMRPLGRQTMLFLGS
jgi:hypothetical protein